MRANVVFGQIIPWTPYQIRNIACCACAGNAGNVFPRRRLQRKPLVSDPGMHHGTCVTHVPSCMSESLTRGSGENVPSIPGACATRNFTYLARGPWWHEDLGRVSTFLFLHEKNRPLMLDKMWLSVWPRLWIYCMTNMFLICYKRSAYIWTGTKILTIQISNTRYQISSHLFNSSCVSHPIAMSGMAIKSSTTRLFVQ